MTRDPTGLQDGERAALAAAVAAWSTADYVAVRALTALSEDAHDRVARFTAMGRDFVADVRRRAREGGADALLRGGMSADERILETATHQILQPGWRELTMSTVSDRTGIPRRTLYNKYPTCAELVEACRRRGQTIWRARFEQRVLGAAPSAPQRLFAAVDVVAEWVVSERFRRDQALHARPSFAEQLNDDDLREHLAEIDRFATALAADAELRAPHEFGAFVTTLVAGASAWFDRCDAARAASVAVVERLVARARTR
ncbi:MAG TPA: TetR/AcrR family transcriptional regulator [Dongiaceae bacterium]|nr:TetR/AcrR family transcriptional regulator [Dongiaceae bacterium]